MRAVQSNLNFPCIHKNKYELRVCNDFKSSAEEIEIEISQSLDDALLKLKSNGVGVAYCQIDAVVKKADFKTFFAECPKIGCGVVLIETENGGLYCEKCSTGYNSAFTNIELSVNVNIDGNEIAMVTNGHAGLNFLKINSAEFAYIHMYKSDDLMSKIAELAGQQFGLMVKIVAKTSGIHQYVIENITQLEQCDNSLTQSKQENEKDSSGESGNRRKRRRN